MQLVNISDLLDIWNAAIVDLTQRHEQFILDIWHTISFDCLVTHLIENSDSCHCFWQSLFFKITSVVLHLIRSVPVSLFSVSVPCQNIYQNHHWSDKIHICYLCMFAFQHHTKRSQKFCQGGIGCLKGEEVGTILQYFSQIWSVTSKDRPLLSFRTLQMHLWQLQRVSLDIIFSMSVSNFE